MTPGSDRADDTPTGAGSGKRTEDDVVGESRWPMAGAVLAAMVLTILLPDTMRLGPKWVLPLIEGALLVAVIAGDPGKINRRSRWLRLLSIVLVSVLVLGALWATVQLIDDLIHGGAVTNSASELLEAGTIVWCRTTSPSPSSTGSSTAAAQQRAPTAFQPITASRSPSN